MDDLKLYEQNKKRIGKLVNTVRIFSEDSRMEFGISKCATLIMKRSIISKNEGIQLPNDDESIKNIEEGEGYKYLGMLEDDGFKNLEIKKKLRKEYFRRIKKTLSKLNSGNAVIAINSKTGAVMRYNTGLIKWKKDELRAIDRKTRKTMSLHGALDLQADVDRFDIPRSNCGRGMISAEDCVEMGTEDLKNYVETSNKRLLKAVEGKGILGDGKSKKEILEKRRKISWKRH